VSCSHDNYDIETTRWDCLCEKSDQYNIDLEVELDKFEAYLIDNDIIADGSGDSYYHFFEVLMQTGDFGSFSGYSFIDSINAKNSEFSFIDAYFECTQLTDTMFTMIEYSDSKVVKIKNAMDSLMNKELFNPKDVGRVFCNILEPSDYEHEYYRLFTMVMISLPNSDVIGLSRKLPPIPDEDAEKPMVKERNVLVVVASTDDSYVMVDGERMLISDLGKRVEEFFLNENNNSDYAEKKLVEIDLLGTCYKSKGIVSLQNHINTSYDTYINVQNQITGAFNTMRNKKSLEYFGLEFSKLSEEQQKAIQTLIPIAVSEAEPRH
jgi:hypothetical protein